MFQQNSPVKPTVLVVTESILSEFKPSRFSAHLSTQHQTVNTVDDAIKILKTLPSTFTAIVIQLITDDVSFYDVKTCADKVGSAIASAKKKAKIVVFSSAPNRGDSGELNQKIMEINQKIKDHYCSHTSKGVVLCDNSNLSENGKPLHKYFKDGVNLNVAGLKQLCCNIKNVLQKVLELDIV